MEQIEAVDYAVVIATEINEKKGTNFLEANTVSVSLNEIKMDHLIPVFKNNQPVISQNDFIQSMIDVASNVYCNETISGPIVRVSHPIKGRIPDAKDKPASDLMEHEKTIFYEKMAFSVQIPTISDTIDGNKLILTFGGVKSYASDNIYSRNGGDECFSIYVGFQNTVCLNSKIWSDGLVENFKVRSIGELKMCMEQLLRNYNSSYHLYHMKQLANYSITEKEFACVIGRCRMYQHLPHAAKSHLPSLLFGDNQVNAVCKDYFRDKSFCKDEHGNINLWRLYNLFTGANKSSYIDTFLERSVNAFDFVENIKHAVEGKSTNWFLN